MFHTKNILNRMMRLTLLASMGFAALLYGASPSLAAAVAPSLGTAWSYTVLGTNSSPTVGTVTCTDTGPGTAINGDVGSTFTSITNTGCTINGAIVAPVLPQVVTDFDLAYSALDSLNPTCDGVIPTTSTTLAPGVYCSAAGTTIGAGVIFTLNGNASDVWVFKIGTSGFGALTGNSFQVVMGGTALACNVYWRTAEAATMTDSNFIGTILAGSAITSTRGSYVGRAMATTDVTVTDAAPMTFAGCAAPASITVNKDFIPNNAATVPVALTCTSGTVTTTPLNASEAAPAVFTVGGALPGATCTATETVPAGYTANQTNCLSVALGGSCTITNTLPAPPPLLGSITIVKNTVGGNGTFNYTGAQSFSIITALGTGSNATAFASVAPGTYDVIETVPAGWNLTGLTCSNASTVNVGTATANVAVAAGEAVTCTYTNNLLAASPIISIPTLNEWGMIIFMVLVGLMSIYYLRRQKAKA